MISVKKTNKSLFTWAHAVIYIMMLMLLLMLISGYGI